MAHLGASAARLDRVGKVVTQGVKLEPAVPGEWRFVDDRTLVFRPAQDWAVGQTYRVTLDRSLFPEHVRLATRELTFQSAPGCRLESQATAGVPPRITSPQQGLTYALCVARVGQETIPLTAVTDSDAHELFWFVDAELVGKVRAGEPLLWHARPGRFAVRAVDDRGRAGAARVEVSVVQ